MNPQQLYVAATTPFTENGLIDSEAYAAHLKFLEANGVEALFCGGTTGEFFSLGFGERVELLQSARANFSGTVVANVSATALVEAQSFAKIAEAEGADAITALPPYYLKGAPAEGIIGYFQGLKAATKLPLIIYNFTRHSQNSFTKEMLEQIDYVAIKDSDKDLSLAEHCTNYLCAGDSAIEESVSAGAVGVVSVQGNYRPAEVVDLFNRARAGENVTALQKEIAQVSAGFRTANQIARIKYGVSLRVEDYPIGVRLPLVEIEEWEKEEIRKTLGM